MNEEISLDPADPFDSVIIEMIRTNRKKRADYAGEDWWTQNFYDTAYQTGTTAGIACENHISTKQSRLRTLFKSLKRAPKNETIEDTLMDRAVYSVISVGLWREGGYDEKTELVLAPWQGDLLEPR